MPGGNEGSPGGERYAIKDFPSKVYKPLEAPIHKMPSGPCDSATMSCGAPSPVDHIRWFISARVCTCGSVQYPGAPSVAMRRAAIAGRALGNVSPPAETFSDR